MVPVVYWPTLAIVVAVVVALRALLRRPLVPRFARTLDAGSVIIAVVCLAALAYHCVAMFFPRSIEPLPLLSSHARSIRSLQLGSELAYWIPSAALILALRGVWLPALGVLSLALVAVGWTMFDGYGLHVHLGAIVAFVMVALIVTAGLVGSPTRNDEV